ncbi:MAG: DUF2865 domain-containing protein [Hyphomicrobiaceae bacterium]|nr:DUF2865 domain-containing protein [Hyphomicrobiaceae bacterium]
MYSGRAALAALFNLVLVLSFGAAGDAHAQSAVCNDLRAQLASVSGGGNATYRRYDQAVQRQRSELASAQRSARRGGCERARTGSCGQLLSTIQRMQNNLSQLIAQRDRHAGGGSSNRRRRIERALAANRCGEAAPREERAERRQGNILSFIFGERGSAGERGRVVAPRYDERGRVLPQPEEERRERREPREPRFSVRGGTFRTMCVRSCDGYYWPISFATTRERFSTDQEACSSMCPGTDVSLYVYPNPGGEPEEMISANGDAPYTALPNAFRFRNEFVAACACQAPRPVLGEAPRADGAGTALIAGTSLRRTVPAPISRVEPSLDPDTVESLLGGLDLHETPDVTTSGGRSVRVVGPTFSYVQ